ncbi:electron transport complex subunit RsxC [Aidingimonas lacisalsi]|uniref:electron transport complex subunit RsxC n=1 Tax=Aidingimonas lacisalsi TaxID=2604086 RepID=UPI0011D18F2C|nr:electron transport complex subunit RsxC [Aidingimonas lacisalsi]
MARDFDFPGGIHPPQRKQASAQEPLRQAPLPSRVVLPLKQHTGAPAEPCVIPGQRVRTGECIAIAQGMISANIHASISGEIRSLEEHAVPHPSGGKAPCLIIDGDGQDEWQRLPSLDWHQTDRDALVERLQQAGVVGLGGATFPTQIKTCSRDDHSIDTLIVNAAECEPYITADDLTLRTYAPDVVEGAGLMALLCGAKRIVIGIEDDKPEALAALEAHLHGTDIGNQVDVPIELTVISTRYPSGGEKQLVKRLLNREVPSRGLPIDVGVLCHNPGTLRAAIRAVRDGEPLVSRIITLTGAALHQPGNIEARLGTPMHALLAQAGWHEAAVSRLVMGGPLMGFELSQADLPVVKASNCLIAATTEELPAQPPEQPCIRCGACETACPAGLLPQQLYWHTRSHDHDKAELFNLFDCIECGACDFVCPSHIPLAQYFRAAKDSIRFRHHEARKAEHARHRFELRQARTEREAAEKEARRQARAAAVKRKSRDRSAGERHETTLDTSQATGGDDVKTLRIAQAAAKAAVRKAEKALARASETGDGDIEDLEVQLATAQENLKATESRLEAARGTQENAQ